MSDIAAPIAGLVREEDNLEDVARHMRELRVVRVVVVDAANRVKGILARADLAQSVTRGEDPASTGAGLVARPVASVDTNTPLHEAHDILRNHPLGVAAVVDEERLVGAVSERDVEALLMLVEDLGPDAAARVVETLPEDPALRRRRGSFIRAGLSALQIIKRVIGEAGKAEFDTLLDFACGHGRILRVLHAALPSVRFAACDVDKEGVDYCAREFGAIPIYSSENPAEVHIDQQFDVIWCGSLFTHLDAHRWPGFLELLRSALAPGGVLVFTTLDLRDRARLRKHGLTDAQVDEMLSGLDQVGVGYAAYTPDVDWGLTVVSPEWVQAQVESQGGLRMLSYAAGAWRGPGPQDVVSCVRP